MVTNTLNAADSSKTLVTTVFFRYLDPSQCGGELARWSGWEHSPHSYKHFLYASKTLSLNPQDSAVPLRQFNF
jgi:hypothetical protein